MLSICSRGGPLGAARDIDARARNKWRVPASSVRTKKSASRRLGRKSPEALIVLSVRVS
jgi:hypothetical protein